ncbi:MAG: SCO family protein [Nitrosomonas sp.]|nr:SCO family protein [Nitrosomonas sp.]
MLKQIKYLCLLGCIVFTLNVAKAATGTVWLSEAPVIPNIELTDQDGHKVRLDELIPEHIVLVNFMFTNCNSGCSPQTAILRATQEAIEVSDLNGKILLISITVDPLTDSPAQLRHYAERFDVRTGVENGWVFLTGSSQQVRRIMQSFGERGSVPEAHTNLIWIGNQAKKRWTRTAALNGPDVLSRLVREITQ